MYREHRIAVVIPAYREEKILPRMLARQPDYLDHLLVVVDGCPEDTAAVARQAATKDPRVEVLELERNQGVGGAICRGYQRALALQADIAVVMAGDDQMDPDDLPSLLDPIVDGQADYCKGDRLAHPERRRMPPVRRLGTSMLAKMTGLIAGLDELRDSQCGYTAISNRVLQRLDLDAIYPRYGYPNDMLLRLAELAARLEQPAVRPVYADERSGLKLHSIVLPISGILLRGAGRKLLHQLSALAVPGRQPPRAPSS